jgi:hypothetical protein
VEITDGHVFALVSQVWTLLLRLSPTHRRSGYLWGRISDRNVEIWEKLYSYSQVIFLIHEFSLNLRALNSITWMYCVPNLT